MRVIKCDKCGKIYSTNNNKILHENSPVSAIILQSTACIYREYELCDECLEKFVKWIGEKNENEVRSMPDENR